MSWPLPCGHDFEELAEQELEHSGVDLVNDETGAVVIEDVYQPTEHRCDLLDSFRFCSEGDAYPLPA